MDASNPDFGGIPAAIENIQEDAEEMITIMTDNGPIQIEKSVYESMPGMFMDTTTSAYGDAGRGRPVPQFANGGRIGLKNGSDGSSTGSFGANRYASELVESADSLLNKGDILMTDAEKLIASGKYPSEEELNEIQKRYDALVNKEETETNKFSKNLEDEKLGDALPYFLEKEKQINKRMEDSNTRADKIGLESLDVSDITRSPSFREWYSLWEKGDPKADKLPQAEYFEDLIFNVDRKKYIKTKFPDIKMADGGLMNLGGREMDMRTGGFIPIGKKERADDVPARLSKNEFVMTADAVRAAGGGSVNKGAKRMYDLMNNLEARV
jgi:hypothetical protein